MEFSGKYTPLYIFMHFIVYLFSQYAEHQLTSNSRLENSSVCMSLYRQVVHLNSKSLLVLANTFVQHNVPVQTVALESSVRIQK